MRLFFFVAAVLGLFSASPLYSQVPVTAEFGGGISLPVNATKDHAHNGFTFVAAAGPRLNSHLSALVDFTFNGMNVTTLHNGTANTTVDATMYLWSLTVNPELTFIKKERVSSYVTGGYGLYYRWLQLTRTAFSPTAVCDSWWDICTNNATDLASFSNGRSTYKGGFNFGAGMTYGERKKLFVEASYHHMFTTNQPTEVIPITFGVRW